MFQKAKKSKSQQTWTECQSKFPIYNSYNLSTEILTRKNSAILSHNNISQEDEEYITKTRTNPYPSVDLIAGDDVIKESFNPSEKRGFISALKRLKLSEDFLDKKTKTTLYKYCCKYGIPTFPSKYKDHYGNFKYIRIYDLWIQILEYQEMVHLWAALNYDYKETLIHLYAKKLDAFNLWQYRDSLFEGIDEAIIKEMIEQPDHKLKYILWESVKNESVETKAKQYLCYLIAQKTKSIIHEDIPHKGDLMSGISFKTPLQFAWYELAKNVRHNIKPARCIYCNEPFNPTREGQLFCPADDEKSFSDCKHNYNSRILRLKSTILSMQEQDITIPEIAKNLRFDKNYLQKRISLWYEKEKEGE